MKRVLAGNGLRLTKSLGQHFLHDGNQLRRIAAAAELGPADKVLEIGPGLGPLTELLVAHAGTVLAIEKDNRLFDLLRKRFERETSHLTSCAPADRANIQPGLELLQADALAYLRENPRDWSEWKLVANLPYSVASPILVELAQAPGPPRMMVATVQLEVAQRLAAQAGQPEYGLLSLLIQLRYEPAGWFRIPSTCFYPRPGVDSACVTLRRRPHPLLEGRQAAVFTRLVKRGFSQRRKMMLKLLKADLPLVTLETAFKRLGLSPQVRAESLSLHQFVHLAETLAGRD